MGDWRERLCPNDLKCQYNIKMYILPLLFFEERKRDSFEIF